MSSPPISQAKPGRLQIVWLFVLVVSLLVFGGVAFWFSTPVKATLELQKGKAAIESNGELKKQ